MFDGPIQPREHNSASQFSESVGAGARNGFRWGLLGAAIGFLVVPAIGIGLAVWGGVTSIAALAAIGAAAAFVAAPITMAATGIGALLGGGIGFSEGQHNARDRVGREHEAARFVNGYTQGRMMVEQQIMQQVAAAQQPPVMPVRQAANDNPSTKISAASIAHQQTIEEAPALGHVKG